MRSNIARQKLLYLGRMQLIRWRTVNGFSVRRAAELCNIRSGGNLSRIEHGTVWPAPATIEWIYWITSIIGPEPVTAEDHVEAWRKANRVRVGEIREAARAGVREHRKLAGHGANKSPGSPIVAGRANGESNG